jgi:hypothetical protein
LPSSLHIAAQKVQNVSSIILKSALETNKPSIFSKKLLLCQA